MDAKELIRIKLEYQRRCRLCDPVRYAALADTRDSFGPLLARPAPGPESTLASMLRQSIVIDHRTSLLEGYLRGTADLSRVAAAFGAAPEELAALEAQMDLFWQPIPDKLVLLTFDDARLSHYTMAAPIVEEFGGRANFFVTEMIHGMMGDTSNFSDKTKFMTWEQIRSLHDAGHEIVNHSLHHERKFLTEADPYIIGEVAGIEQRCAQAGIPKPTAFGYPGGRATAHIMDLLHSLGYQWARGDMQDDVPHRDAQGYYEPLLDSPLAIPSFNCAPGFTKERLAGLVDNTTGGKVLVLAYHEAESDEFFHMSLREQIQTIYERGGQCITFSELSRYIDPEKAYVRTRPASF